MEGGNSDSDESDASSVELSYLERLILKDEGLTVFLSSDANSRESPMTAQQAREYAGALLTNPHVKELRLDFACCRPEAIEAFVPYIRSSEALSLLSMRVDRLVGYGDYAEATAPFQEAVNNIYYAAAQNSNLVEIFADVTASPQAIVKLLSSSTLKTFDLGEYLPSEDEPEVVLVTHPVVTHSQQRALAAGFSRNESLEKVSLTVYDGATPSALRTIIAGLYRHPRLEDLFIDTCENDSELPGCIAQLLGSAPTLREVKLCGDRLEEEEEGETPMEITPLLCVPVEKSLESLLFRNMEITAGHSMHTEGSMLSVSKVSFRDCNFESSESLLVLSHLFGLEKLTIDFGSGLENSFVGNDHMEVMGPGPIEQLVEKHKSLTEISISAPLNDQNISGHCTELVPF